MYNYRKLRNFINLLLSSQNLLTLEKLNPIFKSHEVGVTNGGVIVKYPDSRIEQALRNALLHSDPFVSNMFLSDIGQRGFKETLLWIVVGNIAGCYSYKVENNINKHYARYFLFKESPFYIQALARPAIKLYKKSVVTILDDLPLSLRMTVNFHLENQREDVLNSIADFLNAKELIGVSDIIRDKSISLRAALNNILTITGVKTQSDFSFCLTCGREIKKGQKFCDSTKHRYKNKNHCLMQFNYWLNERLGINTTEGRKNKRNEFYKELVELTKDFHLNAWEEFKHRHPKLYERRYKERWERERELKKREKT